MLRFTPGKDSDADDIDSIITPPHSLKSKVWFSDTPSSVSFSDADGSFTEVINNSILQSTN